jgi:hypothetical protein
MTQSESALGTEVRGRIDSCQGFGMIAMASRGRESHHAIYFHVPEPHWPDTLFTTKIFLAKQRLPKLAHAAAELTCHVAAASIA